jgi:hypothetical protein
MYHRKITRTGLAALVAAATFVQPLLADNTKTSNPDKAVDLGKVEVQGNTATDSILPVGPSSSLYGYELSIKETPRSVYQVTKTQLDEDVIQNYSDLSRYSPSVQKSSSSSPYSTFAIIRGGPSDTDRNGILLLNPAVRPFDNNSWESADIVAGVPSVEFGSTTRTAGYVNYITKQPFFDHQHTSIITSFGRLGGNSNTTYGQYSAQIDNGGPIIKDKLAYRISIQGSEANNYWANSAANFADYFGALTWRPVPKLTVDANFTYTKSSGAYPYGINRVTQDLIDNSNYISGPASPILSYGGKYYRANSAGTYDVGFVDTVNKINGIVNGKFIPSGTTTAATWTQSSPANLVGWVLLPENATTTKIKGNETLYNQDAGSDAKEYIGQVQTTYDLNETYSLHTNSLYQYSKSFVDSYDEYQSFMVNKLFATRVSLTSNRDFTLFGQEITHKSNTGFDFRYLWNECEGTGKSSESPINAADATDAGTLGTAYLLGVSSIYPAVITSANSLYQAEQTKYGWINIAPGYVNSEGRANGLSVASLSGTDRRINQLSTYSLFSEHNLDIGKAWSWRIGARLTRIQDYLRAVPESFAVADQGLLPNIQLSDHANAWNGDINTSLTYRPTKQITTYFTYDFDRASADCGCCLTQGFVLTSPHQGLDPNYYKTVSRLYEVGGKVELIPNQLFASIAAFRQVREIPSVPTASTPYPAEVSILFRGVEASITYQPTKHFSVGANYAYLWATYVNQTASGVFSDYNGFVADGTTIVNNSVSPAGAGATDRGNFRVLGAPLNSGSAWTSYEFSNGFGLKTSAWITSSWLVNRFSTVPTQYGLDVGAFYTYQKWRADLIVHNLTDQKTWSPGGTYGGGTYTYLLPGERIGVTGRITYRF